MENFKIFLEKTEEEKNVNQLISRLPKNHKKLLNKYKFIYTCGNTLNGDKQHVGYIHKNKIVVAAPWNYSREFTTLHEIAHLFFEKLMTSKLKKEWSILIKKTMPEQIKNNLKTKSSLNQNDEEIFCMVYAATYAKYAPQTYINKEWQEFIKNKVPQ